MDVVCICCSMMWCVVSARVKFKSANRAHFWLLAVVNSRSLMRHFENDMA